MKCSHAQHEEALELVHAILQNPKPGITALSVSNANAFFAPLKSAADKGVSQAKYYVALCQRYAIGTIQNLNESLANFQEAAYNDHPYALYELSLCYFYGIGATPNHNIALHYCERACKSNLSRANSMLAYLKETQEFEHDQVAQAFVQASPEYSKGICDIADAYLYGSGIHKDEEIAVEFYTLAASLKNTSALTSLGFCYLNGKGVQQDATMANTYFYEAAIQGNAFAQHALGANYEHGAGVPKSQETAQIWYERAILNGFPHWLY